MANTGRPFALPWSLDIRTARQSPIPLLASNFIHIALLFSIDRNCIFMHTPFMNMTFCVRTFGCQMNKHDSERIAACSEGLGGGLMVDTVERKPIS